MSETPFHTFIELIKVDQAIVDLGNSIEAINQQIIELKTKLDEQMLVVTTAKSNVSEAQKSVDQLELELKTFDQQEKQKKDRLENSTDYKQYQSLKNEIDALKLKQHQYEEILMTAWNKLEAAQKEYEKAQAAYPSHTEIIISDIQAKETHIDSLKKSLEQCAQERPAKEKVVPAEWLEKYSVMRSRVSDPVVPVENNSCSACYYTINQQDLMMLARRKLLQCKSCYRLLYSPELEKYGLQDKHETT